MTSNTIYVLMIPKFYLYNLTFPRGWVWYTQLYTQYFQSDILICTPDLIYSKWVPNLPIILEKYLFDPQLYSHLSSRQLQSFHCTSLKLSLTPLSLMIHIKFSANHNDPNTKIITSFLHVGFFLLERLLSLDMGEIYLSCIQYLPSM